MLSLYPAIFYKEKDGSFSAVFPDLNHLATDGRNLQETFEMAIDCLAGYIYSARLDGETLPAPTEVENIDIHCEDDEYSDYESAFVNIVAIDVEEYAASHFEKAVKKTLTVPENLNQIAMKAGINFSAVLKERLMEVCGFKESEEKISTALPENISSKTVKKTVTVPQWLNEEALAQGVNFSAVLKEGLILACKL